MQRLMQRLLRWTRLGALVAGAALAAGCATQMPAYTAAPDNVIALREAKLQSIDVRAFTLDPANAHPRSVSIRATSLAPADGDFAAYLTQAARADLAAAGRLGSGATRVLSGTLVRNVVDASGFSEGTAEHVARFSLEVDGRRVYDKEHRVQARWDSNFIGAIAIPAAITNFTAGFQALLRRLYTDPEFQQAAR